LRDHQNERPNKRADGGAESETEYGGSECKPMSVQALPSVMKMISVLVDRGGCDQKNALISPVVAANSQEAMMATRTPTGWATMAHVGHSFLHRQPPDRLRCGFAGALAEISDVRNAWRVLNRHIRRPLERGGGE
jgi:hypothetical protein